MFGLFQKEKNKHFSYLGLIISYTKQWGQTVYKIASEMQISAILPIVLIFRTKKSLLSGLCS